MESAIARAKAKECEFVNEVILYINRINYGLCKGYCTPTNSVHKTYNEMHILEDLIPTPSDGLEGGLQTTLQFNYLG